MKNEVILNHIDNMIKARDKTMSDQSRKLSESQFEVEFGDLDTATYYGLRSAFFFLVTGEEDFEAFYDRFSSPAGLDRKTKAIAWSTRFIPDLMSDSMLSDKSLKEKVKDIKSMYAQCVKLEKAFKRKAK